ncbi:MAG: hypothetical protein KGY99_03915 [Phycisphaerae bacterium]|nr:hypothetical protein [Phycisphaerae bacterium]
METCYRIRFRTAETAAEEEVIVEANSPTEAVVKFRHVRENDAQNCQADQVTSVCAENEFGDLFW